MQQLFIGLLTVFVFGSVFAAPPATAADQILEQYFIIHKSLAADSTTGVVPAAAKIAEIGRSAAQTAPKAKTELTALADAAAQLQSNDLKTARNQFGEVSKRLTAYLQAAGVQKKPFQFYCPMAKKAWLQSDKSVRNPYYGSSMLTCGELIP